MGKMTDITGDTPEAQAAKEARKARLRQLVTVGCALVKQRDAFVGSQLSKRELSLRYQLDTSARRYCDDAIEMLSDHPPSHHDPSSGLHQAARCMPPGAHGRRADRDPGRRRGH
jgi:hypothetical protein